MINARVALEESTKMAAMAGATGIPPLGVNKVSLQMGVQYVFVLTGYSTRDGVDTNRQIADDDGDWWLDNKEYKSVRNRKEAALLPLGREFYCVLSEVSGRSFFVGALHSNKLIVRRVGYDKEALFVVPQRLDWNSNRIYAVLQWQAYSDVDPDYMYPADFDYIMNVQLNDVDIKIKEWFAKEREHRLAQRKAQREAQRKAQRDAKLAARRARELRMEFTKGDWYDLMLVRATKYHRQQVSGEADLAVVQPNVVYPVRVIKDKTLWETDAHPQLWLHANVSGQDQALCVQIQTRHPNLLQINQNTGRRALIGDLVWHTYLANYDGEYPDDVNFQPSSRDFEPNANILFGQANFLQLRF